MRVCSKHGPVCLNAHSKLLPEQLAQVEFIRDTNCTCNLPGGHAALCNHFPGQIQPKPGDVIHDGNRFQIFEHPTEIIWRKTGLPGQIVQGDFAPVMDIYIGFDGFTQILLGGIAGYLPVGFQMETAAGG